MALNDHLSRKSVLINLLTLPLVATAAIAAAGEASAATKTPQSAVMYQPKPKDGKKCSGCTLYLPAKDPKANGQCKVVAGSISPNGYCVAYAPKS